MGKVNSSTALGAAHTIKVGGSTWTRRKIRDSANVIELPEIYGETPFFMVESASRIVPRYIPSIPAKTETVSVFGRRNGTEIIY
jgi:hypothetical protein